MTPETKALVEAVSKYEKDVSAVHRCLDAGGDPTYRDERIPSLLLTACGSELNPEVVTLVAHRLKKIPDKELVKQIANQSDFYGETPLGKLCCGNSFPPGYADAVCSVLEIGADSNPLHRRDGKKLPIELYKHIDNPEAAKTLGWMLVYLCESAPGWNKRRSQSLRDTVLHANRKPEDFRGFLEVGIKAYTLCFGFDYSHEDPVFHIQFGKLMVQCAQKGHWSEQHRNTAWYALDYCRDVRDLLTDVSTRLLLPQLLLTTKLHDNKDFLRKLPTQHLVKKLLPVAAELIYQGKIVDGVLGVLKNWNDRRPEFPNELNPLASSGAWYSLTKEFVVPEGQAKGMRVVCMTDSAALKTESKELKHSAENLIPDALNGHSHFFSIRNRAGQVSTFVIRRIAVNGRYEDVITVPGAFNDVAAKLYMEQHRGFRNETILPEESVAAYQVFKHAIETKALGVELEKSGETAESKVSKSHIPPVLLQVGNYISPEMVQSRFKHYAGAKGVAFVPKDNSFRQCDTHLISGEGIITDVDGRKQTRALRDMTAIECFKASDVDDGIRGVITQVYPSLAMQLSRGDTTIELPKETRFI